jgi:hypothetical protein
MLVTTDILTGVFGLYGCYNFCRLIAYMWRGCNWGRRRKP